MIEQRTTRIGRSIGSAWRAAALGLALAGPSAGCVISCTADFQYGLLVTVVDDATGQRVCDAVVRATDGAYQETLMPSGSSHCLYQGAGERAGNYALSAERSGFQTAQRDVAVGEDYCHVDNVMVTIRLRR